MVRRLLRQPPDPALRSRLTSAADARPVALSLDLHKPKCVACLSEVVEIDSTQGQTYCGGCGIVLEENTIVSEVAFGESASGAAVAMGSFVGAGARLSPASSLSCLLFRATALTDITSCLVPRPSQSVPASMARMATADRTKAES